MNAGDPFAGSSMYLPDFNMDGSNPDQPPLQDGTPQLTKYAWEDLPMHDDFLESQAQAIQSDIQMQDFGGQKNKRKRGNITEKQSTSQCASQHRRNKSRRSHNTVEKYRQVCI